MLKIHEIGNVNDADNNKIVILTEFRGSIPSF